MTKRITLSGIFLFALVGALIASLQPTKKSEEKKNIHSLSSRRGADSSLRPEQNGTSTFSTKGRKHAESTSITPALARQMLEESENIVNITERARKSEKIIQDLCLAGFQDEAWSLLTKGQGLVRNYQLTGYFSTAKLTPSQFSEKYDALRRNYESLAALSSWLKQFDTDKVATLLDPQTGDRDIARSRLSDPDLFGSGLSLYFHIEMESTDIAKQKEALDLASSFFTSGLMAHDNAQYIIDSPRFHDAFQKWDSINFLSEVTAPEYLEDARPGTISQMVRSDPNKAIERIGSSNNPHYFQLAVGDWGHADSTQAVRWYTNNKSNLDGPMQSAAAYAFFLNALRADELDGAEQWAREIRDSSRQKEALDLISAKSGTPAGD